MTAIPSFVLKKLYVTGSLRNTPEGCQFQLKNTLAPATITGMGTLIVDGAACEAGDVILLRGNESLPAASASKSRPVSFDINVVVTIVISGLTLSPGEHRIHLDVTSKEAGRLAWDISDRVAG